MTERDSEMPWLPTDAGADFDPLAHADVRLGPEAPLAITPRGGDREVGRSCYQVDTEHATYLVDCGLKQGGDEQFPDFRGLAPSQVEAVFLTHAHIDHCGGLPVLEARGLLDDEAPIIATPPTIDLATLLLRDSLKIHQQETTRRERQFTDADVATVIERFEPVDYGGGLITGLADVPSSEQLVFRLGNAGHLLGSAWLSFQTNGYKAVFSGDLGGRTKHLPDIEHPPSADLLVIESTYGAQHSHTAVSDAHTTLFTAVEEAVRNREPVLIPTFAVGRAQTLQLLFADRFRADASGIADQVRLVVDGMAQDATDVYHDYVADGTYMAEGMVNRVTESGHEAPFRPTMAEFVQTDADRRRILNDIARSEGHVPIIIAPSGMLTGGNSPRYLTEFAARFDRAKVFLTGYQAVETTGRVLQNHVKAGEDEITYTTEAEPLDTDWPSSPDVTWTTIETETGMERVTRATIPAEWVQTISGFSAHAAQHGLLEFARDVTPHTIMLIHGPEYAQDALARHFANTVESAEQIGRARRLTPTVLSREIELDTAKLTPETVQGTSADLRDLVDSLYEQVGALNEELAAVRNETGLSEDEIRDIVRDELAQAVGTEEDD